MRSIAGETTAELVLALEVAEAAGDLLLDYATRDVRKRHKSGRELVSEADFAAQRLIVDTIRETFPSDGVVAEESIRVVGRPEAGRRWFVDPLDGTTNFLKGQARWGTSIAFYDGAGGAMGVVTCPPRGETYYASVGGGAYLGEEPLTCSDVGNLADAVVTSGFPYDFSNGSNLEEWAAITPQVLTVRCLGAAALDLCDVASGRSDAFWEQGLGLWDTAAGVVIAAESGALVTDMEGAVLTEPSRDVVVANPELHRKVLTCLRSGSAEIPVVARS